MVLEFLPGGDLEKLIMRCGKLEERAVRYVWWTNYIIRLQKTYSDPDEFDVILINVRMFPAKFKPYIPVCKVRAIVGVKVIS